MECKDHLGNTYDSVKEMCKHYGINPTTYRSRIKAGKSVEEALTFKTFSRRYYTDHLGNIYGSIKDMAKAYGITEDALSHRLNKGLSVAEALTLKIERTCQDHLGNEYENLTSMCNTYGISLVTFRGRIKRGYTLEKALTKEVSSVNIESIDYNGIKYNSIKDMCNAHNIRFYTFYKRINEGCTLEQALAPSKKEIHKKLIKKSKNKVEDHLGNKYSSIKEMCLVYNITYSAFRKRIRSGMTLEDALTTKKDTKIKKVKGKKCIDHLGKEYASIKDLCDAYGINRQLYTTRLKRGLTIEEILTTQSIMANSKVRELKSKGLIEDHIGNKYDSILEMCNHYNVEKPIFEARIRMGWGLEKALTFERYEKCYDHLGNIFESVNDMCRHYKINKATFRQRIKKGIPLELALSHGKVVVKPYFDHLGVRYDTLKELCNHYNISSSIYYTRTCKNKWNRNEALIIPVLKHTIKKSYVGIDNKQYYQIKTPEKIYYLNAEQIIEMNKQGLFD